MLAPQHVMLFSLALFSVGVIGVLLRRNAILILMSIELMLNAANVNLVAFAWARPDVAGQVLAMFVIAVAAGETAVGLAILIALFRNRASLNVDDIDLLKW
jgi:NADH-quinone oxidoreductase subunit K